MEEKMEEKIEDVAKFILNAEKKQFDLAAVKPVCEVGKSWSVMLPMSDSICLETKIWLPDQEQKDYPIILKRNCYSMQIPMLELQAKEYARRGFGFVVQSCRGTMKSEGVWEPNVNERQDGSGYVRMAVKTAVCQKHWLLGGFLSGFDRMVYVGCSAGKGENDVSWCLWDRSTYIC